jgi:CRP-like cAMP-binding protein
MKRTKRIGSHQITVHPFVAPADCLGILLPEPMEIDVPTALPSNGLFAELSHELRTRLAAAGQFRVLPVGTYLMAQGEAHHGLVVILQGRLTVTVHAHGDTVQVAELGPGHTVGEMNLIDPHKASADVVAVEPASVWTISEEAFRQFVDQDPRAGYAILKLLSRELCRRLRHNNETMLRQIETTRAHFRDNDY